MRLGGADRDVVDIPMAKQLVRLATKLPARIAKQWSHLDAARRRLSSPIEQEILTTTSVLTAALIFTLEGSQEQLDGGISMLDSLRSSATTTYEADVQRLTSEMMQAANENAESAQSLLPYFQRQRELANKNVDLALHMDEVFRGSLLSFSEHWFEAAYRALGFFESERQREQLRTLATVLVGMIPGVGTLRDLIDLSQALRSDAVKSADFHGLELIEEYSTYCRLLLVQFEILTDLGNRSALVADTSDSSLDQRLEVYELELGSRADKRIIAAIAKIHNPDAQVGAT